jgi:hypothetical protein
MTRRDLDPDLFVAVLLGLLVLAVVLWLVS